MPDDYIFDARLHRHYIGGRRVTGITEALRLTGLKKQIQSFGMNHASNIEYAGQRGTAVHKMCELDNQGQTHLYDLDANLLGYLTAWRLFKKEFGFTPLGSEKPMGHPIYQFGGIPDSWGIVDKVGGKRAVVEMKTRVLDPDDVFQIAAQAILLEHNIQFSAEVGLLMQLKADGSYSHVLHQNLSMPKKLFLSAVPIANHIIAREG